VTLPKLIEPHYAQKTDTRTDLRSKPRAARTTKQKRQIRRKLHEKDQNQKTEIEK